MNRRIAAFSVLVASATFASAQANFIYGLSQASAGAKVELVHVNVQSGTQTNFADLGNIAGSGNGLASVLGTARFYFSAGNKLYGYDHAAPVGQKLKAFTGNLAVSPDDAAWYQGSYYYISGANLRKVTPDFATGTFSETIAKTFAGSFSTFGDITFNTTSTNPGDGTLYISSNGGSYSGISKYQLGSSNNAPTMIAAGVQQMQLGFSQDNNLYGVFSGGTTATVEQVFQINIANGNRTLLSTFSNGASVYIRDAATAPTPPVPEPASMAVLGLGLAALRRRRNAKKN